MSKFEESNFYKALQDFFINADKKTFLQFLAEFYNRTESIIDKDNIQDDLIKELRELYLEFNEKGIDENIVREKVNYFLENNVKIKDIISKLDTKTNRVETQRLQNQVNNLVLGAVGDGNNAEVVSSRGDFNLLGNRLDDFDARTDSLVNIRNVFTDKCIKSKSWGVINGDYNIDYGSSFSNAIIAQNGNSNITLFKDINVSKITSGNYVFNLNLSSFF